MKASIIHTEKRNDGIEFILSTIQGYRKRPQKYRHYIRIPILLYNELVERKVFIPEDFWSEETAYFEYDDFVTISFINYCHIEDLHVRMLDYLVRKFNDGENPVIRGGHSKL